MKNKFLIVSGVVLGMALSSLSVQAQDEASVYVYQDKGNRDPFWPLINDNGTLQNYEKEYLLTDLELEGIMAAGEKNVAIINGKVVKASDVLGEYVVTEIQSNKVILLKGQQTFELQLHKGE